MAYTQIIFSVLMIALVCAIISTNVINGLKTAFGFEKAWINRVLTFLVNLLISIWVYFVVIEMTDYMTYAVVFVMTYAGAETVYKTIGELQEARSKYHDEDHIDKVI